MKFKLDNLIVLFGGSYEETDTDWILKKRSYNQYDLKVRINKDIFNKKLFILKEFSLKEYCMYSKDGKYFECPITSSKINFSSHLTRDDTNNLEFKIDDPTENYSLTLYLSKKLGSELWYKLTLDEKIRVLSEKGEIDFYEYISVIINQIIKLKTLKIKSGSSLKYSEYLKLAKNYLFYMASDANIPISLRDPFKVSYKIVQGSHYYNSDNIFELELNNELVDYYKRGIGSDDLFIQFISFYHIIEYFFEIILNDFKKPIIVVPNDFKHNKEELKIFIKNNIREKEKLKLVLLKFITLNDFKTVVDDEFYKNLENPVKFANAKPINEERFHETLANRIYNIRNSLVHRKEKRSLNKYLPYKENHNEELKMEIPIIKAITTLIILQDANS